MIRLLQTRLNDDTVGIDKTRPEKMELPLELRREIEALKDSQEEIRDSLAKVAERANPTGDETPANPAQFRSLPDNRSCETSKPSSFPRKLRVT